MLRASWVCLLKPYTPGTPLSTWTRHQLLFLGNISGAHTTTDTGHDTNSSTQHNLVLGTWWGESFYFFLQRYPSGEKIPGLTFLENFKFSITNQVHMSDFKKRQQRNSQKNFFQIYSLSLNVIMKVTHKVGLILLPKQSQIFCSLFLYFLLLFRFSVNEG